MVHSPQLRFSDSIEEGTDDIATATFAGACFELTPQLISSTAEACLMLVDSSQLAESEYVDGLRILVRALLAVCIKRMRVDSDFSISTRGNDKVSLPELRQELKRANGNSPLGPIAVALVRRFAFNSNVVIRIHKLWWAGSRSPQDTPYPKDNAMQLVNMQSGKAHKIVTKYELRTNLGDECSTTDEVFDMCHITFEAPFMQVTRELDHYDPICEIRQTWTDSDPDNEVALHFRSVIDNLEKGTGDAIYQDCQSGITAAIIANIRKVPPPQQFLQTWYSHWTRQEYNQFLTMMHARELALLAAYRQPHNFAQRFVEPYHLLSP